MTDEQRDSYEASQVVGLLGEIGSRQSQRLLVMQVVFKEDTGEKRDLGLVINDWIEVQEGCYRYLAVDDGDEISIKIVIGEYLACEVVWAR